MNQRLSPEKQKAMLVVWHAMNYLRGRSYDAYQILRSCLYKIPNA